MIIINDDDDDVNDDDFNDDRHNRSMYGKMKVLINYDVYNIIYDTIDGSAKERWTVQAIDHGAMDRHE